MDDDAVLVQHLVVDDEIVAALERVGVLGAGERELCRHRLAAELGVARLVAPTACRSGVQRTRIISLGSTPRPRYISVVITNILRHAFCLIFLAFSSAPDRQQHG